MALGNEISMAHGTLKFDAALYDGAYLFIPFRYAFHEDAEDFAELKAGTDIRKTSLWNDGTVAGFHERPCVHGQRADGVSHPAGCQGSDWLPSQSFGMKLRRTAYCQGACC